MRMQVKSFSVKHCKTDSLKEKQHDMMGKILGEVFVLAALDQESTKQWTACVEETFEKCGHMSTSEFSVIGRGLDRSELCWLERARKSNCES